MLLNIADDGPYAMARIHASRLLGMLPTCSSIPVAMHAALVAKNAPQQLSTILQMSSSSKRSGRAWLLYFLEVLRCACLQTVLQPGVCSMSIRRACVMELQSMLPCALLNCQEICICRGIMLCRYSSHCTGPPAAPFLRTAWLQLDMHGWSPCVYAMQAICTVLFPMRCDPQAEPPVEVLQQSFVRSGCIQVLLDSVAAVMAKPGELSLLG